MIQNFKTREKISHLRIVRDFDIVMDFVQNSITTQTINFDVGCGWANVGKCNNYSSHYFDVRASTVNFLSAEFAGDINCEINYSAYLAAIRYLGAEGCINL